MTVYDQLSPKLWLLSFSSFSSSPSQQPVSSFSSFMVANGTAKAHWASWGLKYTHGTNVPESSSKSVQRTLQEPEQLPLIEPSPMSVDRRCCKHAGGSGSTSM